MSSSTSQNKKVSKTDKDAETDKPKIDGKLVRPAFEVVIPKVVKSQRASPEKGRTSEKRRENENRIPQTSRKQDSSRPEVSEKNKTASPTHLLDRKPTATKPNRRQSKIREGADEAKTSPKAKSFSDKRKDPKRTLSTKKVRKENTTDEKGKNERKQQVTQGVANTRDSKQSDASVSTSKEPNPPTFRPPPGLAPPPGFSDLGSTYISPSHSGGDIIPDLSLSLNHAADTSSNRDFVPLQMLDQDVVSFPSVQAGLLRSTGDNVGNHSELDPVISTPNAPSDQMNLLYPWGVPQSTEPHIDSFLDHNQNSSTGGFDVMNFLDGILNETGPADGVGTDHLHSALFFDTDNLPSSEQMAPLRQTGHVASNPWASDSFEIETNESRALAYGIAFDETAENFAMESIGLNLRDSAIRFEDDNPDGILNPGLMLQPIDFSNIMDEGEGDHNIYTSPP